MSSYANRLRKRASEWEALSKAEQIVVWLVCDLFKLLVWYLVACGVWSHF